MRNFHNILLVESPPEIGTLVCKINHQWALWLAKIIKAASQFQACLAYLKCLNRFLSVKVKEQVGNNDIKPLLAFSE